MQKERMKINDLLSSQGGFAKTTEVLSRGLLMLKHFL